MGNLEKNAEYIKKIWNFRICKQQNSLENKIYVFFHFLSQFGIFFTYSFFHTNKSTHSIFLLKENNVNKSRGAKRGGIRVTRLIFPFILRYEKGSLEI